MSIENHKPCSLDSIRPTTSGAIHNFEVYPLMDELREKFSDDEIEFAMKGRESFVMPLNKKDAELHSKLIDQVCEVVFKHLINSDGRYTHEEALLSTVMFPVWKKEDLSLSPLFFTNIASVIFFAMNYLGEPLKASVSYKDAKSMMYSYLAPLHIGSLEDIGTEDKSS